MYWIDTHSHFASEEFRDHFDDYIKRAITQNVGKILCICLNKEELEQGQRIQKQYPQLIDLAFGYHPEDVAKLQSIDFEYLEEVLKNDIIIAVGEIGLDYHWDTSYNELQVEKFIQQIELANKYHKPILIHSRDAIQETLDILKQHPTKGIMHCYSGSYEMALEFIKVGMYISLAGPVTFKNARVPKEVASKISLEYLFTETDCPYMTPEPYRGKKNESGYVHLIGEQIAQIKEIGIEQVQEQMIKNYQKLFKR